MNSENIKKVTNQAIEQLVAALNQGHSEPMTQYLAAIGRFHRYSLRNVMLIASQKPTATHVAGFHAWHKLGRFVKKGEKGIVILAPIVRRKNESAKQDETDESTTAGGLPSQRLNSLLLFGSKPGELTHEHNHRPKLLHI